jgi:hypothetical protein
MTTINLPSPDEIMAETQQKLGHLFAQGQAKLTTETKNGQTWVWLECEVKLSKGTPDNTALREIGYWWSHTRKQWFHRCDDIRSYQRRITTTTTTHPPRHEPPRPTVTHHQPQPTNNNQQQKDITNEFLKLFS